MSNVTRQIGLYSIHSPVVGLSVYTQEVSHNMSSNKRNVIVHLNRSQNLYNTARMG